MPLYKFDQQRDPFKFLGFVILAGGIYEVDCGGGRIYAGIAGSGIAAAGITYGVASWGLGYIPDLVPGASLVKRHVPTVLGVSAGLLVTWTQLNDSECLVPISYAITTAGMGLAELAIIGSLTGLALFSTYMAASGVVNVWKRRSGGRAVKKLIESTEGKTWDNIKLQYLTKLIAIANKFAMTADGDGYEQLYRSFAKKIRVSTKKKILKAHEKYSKAHKIWKEKTGVEGLVRSSVTGEPTLSSFVEHLKDEIITEVVRAFIVDTLEEEKKQLDAALKDKKAKQEEGVKQTKELIQKLKEKNNTVGEAELRAAVIKAEKEITLLGLAEVDDALRVTILTEIAESATIRSQIIDIFKFNSSLTAKSGNAGNTKEPVANISLQTAKEVLEKCRGSGSAAAESANAATSAAADRTAATAAAAATATATAAATATATAAARAAAHRAATAAAIAAAPLKVYPPSGASNAAAAPAGKASRQASPPPSPPPPPLPALTCEKRHELPNVHSPR